MHAQLILHSFLILDVNIFLSGFVDNETLAGDIFLPLLIPIHLKHVNTFDGLNQSWYETQTKTDTFDVILKNSPFI